MSKLLAAKGVKKNYQSGSRSIEVLRGVNLEISKGEACAIVGASGAGKSTLLHLLGALDRPTKGAILLDGVDYTTMNGESLAALRNRRIGFIYQFHHLLPEFTALENVMLPGMIRLGRGESRGSVFASLGKRFSPARMAAFCLSLFYPSPNLAVLRDLRESAEKILAHVGLSERLTHRPAKLSGGEQQRVALARALINDPDLVLADEPTGNLDLATGDVVFDVILERTVKSGKTLILVTHNPDIAERLGAIYHLKNGVLSRS
jgi:lipoprotein-releasing system ATP-binding protein